MDMKTLGIVVVAAVASAVVVTGIQKLLFDGSNSAVTSGVTGAVCAVIAVNTMGAKKKED